MLIEEPGQRLRMRNYARLCKSMVPNGLKLPMMWRQGMETSALKDGQTQLIHASIVAHGAPKT